MWLRPQSLRKHLRQKKIAEFADLSMKFTCKKDRMVCGLMYLQPLADYRVHALDSIFLQRNFGFIGFR